ncbi:MAG: DNA polymerase III subunit epsilon, partial [Pseudomonadota bacterium]|nr:DNA polymerase III subunit epsilon [Pseudomonadota bacterium]
MRQVVLDTETTGLEPEAGHRIIEIGAVEIVGRRLTGRHFHQYLKPDRAIDEGAQAVHGLTAEFLADKPRFADIAEALQAFLSGAEVIIHNAPFDVGFLDAEWRRLSQGPENTAAFCEITDSLTLARRLHPGQKNSLDALCRRYDVDNTERTLHGALLDAELLADVFLAMTGGQTALGLGAEDSEGVGASREATPAAPMHWPKTPRAVLPSESEAAHRAYLEAMEQSAGEPPLWLRNRP